MTFCTFCKKRFPLTKQPCTEPILSSHLFDLDGCIDDISTCNGMLAVTLTCPEGRNCAGRTHCVNAHFGSCLQPCLGYSLVNIISSEYRTKAELAASDASSATAVLNAFLRCAGHGPSTFSKSSFLSTVTKNAVEQATSTIVPRMLHQGQKPYVGQHRMHGCKRSFRLRQKPQELLFFSSTKAPEILKSQPACACTEMPYRASMHTCEQGCAQRYRSLLCGWENVSSW